ncbi:unnamed protein product [Tilletia caries]|nr:unnamed protein product [Tilletia caries]
MIPARKPRRLTRRRRRDELDADGADCYTADSEQLYGSTISEPAMNMAHNDLPTFSDPYALQRASHQVQEFMDLYDGNNDDYGDGPGFGFVEDYGNDGSGSRYPQSDPSDEYDSDEGAVDIHGNPILVQNFNPRRCPLPRSNKETTRRRFAAWHQASNVIFKTAYDTDPTPRFPALPVISCDCPLDAPRHSLSIIHVYDIGKPMVVAGRTCSLIKSLISIGFFPSSPSAPRVAFTIRLLRLYQTLLNQVGMPANNMAATVQTLMRLEPTFQRSYSALTTGDVLRRQLSSAVTWMTVVERYAQQMATEVARWTPSRPSLVDDDLHLTLYDLIESCPACFQAFATPTRLDSQTLRSQLPHDAADLIHPRVGTWPAPTFGLDRDSPQVIVAIDGNFTQKRRRRADVINAQPMPPRRFLSARQSIAAERAWQNALGNDPDKESCVASIRAIDHASAHNARTPFDVNGVMGVCCRNDIPLVLCDITTPGERHFYATALIGALAEAIPQLRHLGVVYDLGCRFDPSTRVRNLIGPSLKITWTVPLFHVYGHTYSWQVRYSPRNVLGYGLTDGEGMERVWSGLRNLITSTRSMRAGDRRFSLEERCLHLATERRMNLFKFIRSKRSKINQVIEEARLPLPSANTSTDGANSTITVVSLISQSLLRVMSEIRLLSALVRDRPANTSRGTKTTVRLQLSLKTESVSARKLMKRLNTALSTHFQALGRYPPVLEWDTLLKGEQFKLVEHWACADNPSLDDLPWWTNPSTAKAINAFEELLRAVEENERLEHERSSALAWIDNRIMRTGELRHTHSVYRDEHTRATALKNYWLGSAPAEDILFPSGVPIDHNTLSSDQADEVEVDIDVELEAQVARLAT